MVVEQRTARVDAAPASPAAGRADDVTAVRGALAGLGPLEREVVVLRLVERLDLDVIAAMTGATRTEVSRRLRRSAVAIERAAGWSVGREVTPDGRRLEECDEDALIEDLRLGVTPQLAARVRSAWATDDLSAGRTLLAHRRRLQVQRWVRCHAGGLLAAAAAVLGVELALAAVASVGPL